MRRVLVAALALVALAVPIAAAQSGDWSGGWTDPPATGTRDGKPLAYLDVAKALAGSVSHPNGVSRVSAVIVPNPDSPPPAGCDPVLESVSAEPSGTSATFQVNATFPCDIVYELRATAEANPSGDVTPSTPSPYQLPLFLAVVIPPAPVENVEATLEVDGNDRTVTLAWSAGSEPDLLGYVVTRTSGGETETLGQVDAGDDTELVDDNPPKGATSRYDVVAIRSGPDNQHEQVAAAATAVRVDVPPDAPADADANGDGQPDSNEPPLTTIVTGAPSQGRPDPSLLSSVNAAGPRGQPAPPTTLDTGFSETLTYPTLPNGEQATGPTGDPAVVVTFDEGSKGSPFADKGSMRMVAGGLVLLMGFFLITYLTRRAARAEYEL